MNAQAQSTPVPSSADVGRIQENMRDRLKEERSTAEYQPEKKATFDSTENADKVTFKLNTIRFDNMTAYTLPEIKRFYAASIGKTISLQKLLDIIASVQKKYIDDGYTLTKIVLPPQDITQGNIHIDVIEGYIAEVETKGDIVPSTVIDAALVELKTMNLLNIRKLERIMLILNDLPASNFSSILATPLKTHAKRGAVRLILESTKDKTVNGYISLNNNGSVFAGPWQTFGGITLSHAGLAYSALDLSASATLPMREVRYGAARYTIPVFGISGTKMFFSMDGARTEPGENLRELEVKGRSSQFSTGISYPLIRQRGHSLFVRTELNLKQSETDLAGETLYKDSLRVVQAGTNYTVADQWRGINSADMTVAKGLDILGARKTGTPDLSRAEGHSDFTKFTGSLSRRQGIGQSFELFLSTEGQYANSPLLSAEEFGLGGGTLGRGYDPSEITGDHGVSGTVELRHTKAIPTIHSVIQPFAFYDVGKVWNIDRNAKSKTSLASTGLGVRMEHDNGLSGQFTVAVPLTRAQDNPPPYTEPHGARILVSILKRF